MCCFSGPVRSVANTRIFARKASASSQFLVYAMHYAADQPMAMILPLPVVAGDGEKREKAVRFLSLKGYPRFFEDMEQAFPQPARGGGLFGTAAAGGAVKSAPLPVEEVGDFVASYVPTVADFDRLDKRFTLPRQTWDRLPTYRDYGFAVFQLKQARAGKKVHPMALEFATRAPDRLFFPTVHIHDGKVHPREDFDHVLYFQGKPRPAFFMRASRAYVYPGANGVLRGAPVRQTRSDPGGVPAEDVRPVPDGFYLTESRREPGSFLNVQKTRGIVSPSLNCAKMEIRQRLANQDMWLRIG